MRTHDEPRDPTTLTYRRREPWWNPIRLGFLLIFTGGLVMAAAFALLDWTPRSTARSSFQVFPPPPICNVGCPGADGGSAGWLLAGVWLLTTALCLLVGGYHLAKRSLEQAGAAIGALSVVLVLGIVAASAVIALIFADGASLFLHSTTLLAFAGLGIALTGGVLALREPTR